MATPRALVVHRRSELDELLDRHGTRGQTEFFLRSRGRDLGAVQDRHDRLHAALEAVDRAVPAGWRRGRVERGDLPRFLFEPDDVLLAVGPDGLVANLAKYLDGQPVVGVDPEPGSQPGVLVRHGPDAVARVLAAVAGGRAAVEPRSMVEAELDDGQRLAALNEIFVGDAGHQSARYRLFAPSGPEGGERQSSSGVVVGTGTGATGWCASLVIGRDGAPPLPAPTSEELAWFVREAWPSPATGTAQTAGLLVAGTRLRLTVESDRVVTFGDGLEADRLVATWGQDITVGVSRRRLALVV
jgi:hypothetical protein